MSVIAVAPGVKASLSRYGLTDRVPEILNRAAIVSHPKGNRRYHHWVFNVVNGTLVGVTDIRKPLERASNGTFMVWEECECNRLPSCPQCKGKGEYKVYRKGR